LIYRFIVLGIYSSNKALENNLKIPSSISKIAQLGLVNVSTVFIVVLGKQGLMGIIFILALD
tara:strand:+ start:318 stop:503 length:186 start_codon:yes stop_codon:yes gene_type:complete